jgi:hypothetical protein
VECLAPECTLRQWARRHRAGWRMGEERRKGTC